MPLSNAPTRYMSDAAIQVTVVYAHAPRQVFETLLELPPGACVQDALRASGVLAQYPALVQQLRDNHCSLAIWGTPVGPSHVLKAQDRLAVCRPLQIDPMTARRERFKRQGIKRAGLFKPLKDHKPQ